MRSARQSIISCSDREANCTAARHPDTLELSGSSAWSSNDSAVDALQLEELQLPAAAATTVSLPLNPLISLIPLIAGSKHT